MKSIRQFSHKKNFEVKNNDVFNLDRVPLLTLNEVRRGKKHVDNVRLSNFNGISLNFDYNKRVVDGTLNELTELDTKFHRPMVIGKLSDPKMINFVDKSNVCTQPHYEKLVKNSNRIDCPNMNNIELTKCNEIQITNEGSSLKPLSQKNPRLGVAENPQSIKNEYSTENQNASRNDVKCEDVDFKLDGTYANIPSNLRTISNNEVNVDEKQSLRFQQNIDYKPTVLKSSLIIRPDLPPLQIPAFTPLTKNSRNIINKSMIKDYNNLASITSKIASIPAISNIDSTTPIVAFPPTNLPIAGKSRYHSAQPPSSTKNESNVSRFMITNKSI